MTIRIGEPACGVRRWWRGALLLLVSVPAAAQSPPAWRVTTLDQMDLWFHGVAAVGLGVAEPGALYDPTYTPLARRTRERLGLAPTPLERAARSMGRTFSGDRAFEILHFLPLYFADDDWRAMRQALRTLADGSDGAPDRGDPRTRRTVAALALALPQPAQRLALLRFAELLDDEWRLYLRDETRRTAGTRAAQAAALERRWNDEFAPALARYLAQIHRERGTILLSPVLGREGRTVQRGAPAGALVAIAAPRTLAPDATTAAAFDVLRELCFATVRVVDGADETRPSDPVAAEHVSRTAAVRCGALVLQRYLPRYRAAYEARYLTAHPSPETTPAADRFRRAYPLPPAVEHRLARAIDAP